MQCRLPEAEKPFQQKDHSVFSPYLSSFSQLLLLVTFTGTYRAVWILGPTQYGYFHVLNFN